MSLIKLKACINLWQVVPIGLLAPCSNSTTLSLNLVRHKHWNPKYKWHRRMKGAKQRMELIEKKSKSMMAIRKIKSFDEDFEVRDFVDQAQDIYEIMHNCVNKTIHWKFVKSLEPPRVVHARCTDVISKDNIFGQVTVRFHTQQILAVYDRFGRLMHGSEILAKDVLEYVVFEKHLSNQYGLWRIHEKIVPDWMPPKDPLPKTYVVPKETEETEETTSTAVEATPPQTEIVTHQPQVTA
ncbi:putative 39S ribosomal protein L45 [Blattella germanica]|nr:putative 39S ribosomal protein L45 [Blattella germanica]